MPWLDFPLDCHHAAEDKVYSSLWEFHHVFFLPFPNRKRRVFQVPWKIKKLNTHTLKQLENKMADQRILDSMSKWSWGIILLQYLYSASYITPWDSSKNWEVWELQKREWLRQLMSTFGFLFQVTCLSLHRRLRSEASVGEVCFDVVLAFCCKGKRIPEIKKIYKALFHLNYDNYEV